MKGTFMFRLVALAATLAALAGCMPPETPAEPDGTGIPAALHGRWGLTAADCIPGRADNKGLMTVTAEGLRFYESRATLARVDERSMTRLMALFDFSGEGYTWQRGQILDLQDGGATLVRREYGPEAMDGVLRYSACG